MLRAAGALPQPWLPSRSPELTSIISEGTGSVYVLFVDESGDVKNPDRGHAVLGGLAVHEADIVPMRDRVEALLTRRLDRHPRGVELHANHVRGGKGPWRSIARPVRDAVLAGVATLIASFDSGRPLALLGVVRAPGVEGSTGSIEGLYSELVMRFDSSLRSGAERYAAHEGMIVCDEAPYERAVQQLVLDGPVGGRAGSSSKLVEVPLFVESLASRLIQLADFVVNSTYRAYEHNDTAHFDRISARFHREAHAVRGLVHVNRGRGECVCLACSPSRGG